MQFAAALYSKAIRAGSSPSAPAPGADFKACQFSPVRDLSLEVSGTAEGVYTLLWKDARRLKLGAGEGGVLSETSGSVTASSVLQLMSLIDRICSAQCRLRPDEVDSAVAADSAGGSASSGAGEPVVLHLQRQDDRASMRKVTVFANGRGQLQHFTISDNAAASQMSDTRASALMMMLSEMCSGSSPFVVVRPPLWAELPSELWWHVVNRLTKKEGRAVSCSCKMVAQMVVLPTFIWVHEKIYLDIVHAAENVKSDKRTNLPLNLVDGEIMVGRSRNNTVVLLRDTEMSKEHCRLWRDARGDIWIQDLASTNGTNVNGQLLRSENNQPRVPGVKQKSECTRLAVHDKIKLGLTTLALFPGHVERDANGPAAASSSGAASGANDGSEGASDAGGGH